MANQSGYLKRPAPADRDDYRPSKASRVDPLSQKASIACSDVLGKPSSRARPKPAGRFSSSKRKSSYKSQKSMDRNAVSSSANGFAQSPWLGPGVGNAYTRAESRDMVRDNRPNHSESSASHMPRTLKDPVPETPFPFTAEDTKGKEKVKPTEELDLLDPTVRIASSSAPPQTCLQNLLKTVTSTKKVFEKHNPNILISSAPIITMIKRWEGQLWRGLQEIKEAEDERVVTINDDIGRQLAREAKYEADLAAKETWYKKKLAQDNLLWNGKLKQKEMQWQAWYDRQEKAFSARVAKMNEKSRAQLERVEQESQARMLEARKQFDAQLAELEKQHAVKMKAMKEQMAIERAEALQTPEVSVVASHNEDVS